MKNYQVELKRTSYVYINIDADSPEEAEKLAWDVAADGSWGEGDANWELETIELTQGAAA
jgi:predicted transport protein